MTRVAIVDVSDVDKPTKLVEYELQNGVATPIYGRPLDESDNVAVLMAPGKWRAVQPKDGDKFLEGLFWSFKSGRVFAQPVDAGGEKIAKRCRKRLDRMMKKVKLKKNK